MPNVVTPRDLQTLSNSILDGSMKADNVPKNAQAALQQYWTQQGLDPSTMKDPGNVGDIIARRNQQQQGWLNKLTSSPIFKPTWSARSKCDWLDSHSAPPLVYA